MRTALSFALAALPALVAADYGWDVSSATMPSSFQCGVNQGVTFTIIRCWESIGQPDPNCPHTIYNAWNGGMSDVDIYFFPDFSAGNPQSQVDQVVSYLASYNVTNRSPYGPPHTYGMIWFDIEGPEYWGNPDDNVAFIQGLLAEASAQGLAVGIYTSESQWGPITNNSPIGSSYPLWYAHYDGNPSYSDFSPFAGWSSPSIKQFAGTTSVCGASVDQNWYP